MKKLLDANRKNISVFILNFFALSFLCVFCNVHYSNDAWDILCSGSSLHIDNFIGSFRYFGAFLYRILTAFGHNPILSPAPDTVFFIFAAALSSTVLVRYLYSLLRQKSAGVFLTAELSVLISVVNVWFTDLLSFPECIFLTGVGLAFCLIGVVVSACADRWWKHAAASILLICSVAVYQQFLSLFLVYAITVLCIKSICSDEPSLFKRVLPYLKTAFIVLIDVIIYYGIAMAVQKIHMIAPSRRTNLTVGGVLEQFVYFISHQHSFLKGRGFFATEIMTVLYVFAALICGITLVYRFFRSKHKLSVILLAAAVAVAYVSSYFAGLISTSNATRTLFPLFSVLSLFAMVTVSLTNKKTVVYLLAGILSVAVAVNVFTTVKREVDQIAVNTVDIEYAKEIVYFADQYEAERNLKLNTVVVSYDGAPDISSGSSAFYTDYALRAILRNHFRHPIDIEIADSDAAGERFHDGNWNVFSPGEQMLFESDVLYLCVY